MTWVIRLKSRQFVERYLISLITKIISLILFWVVVTLKIFFSLLWFKWISKASNLTLRQAKIFNLWLFCLKEKAKASGFPEILLQRLHCKYPENPLTPESDGDWHIIYPNSIIPWITQLGNEDKGSGHWLKKYLIVKKILFIRTLGDVQRTVWRIFTLMLGCKGLNVRQW